MNIVFLTRYFYPHIGGVEKHCLKLGKELVKRGHNLTVVTSTESLKQDARVSNKSFSKDRIDNINVLYIKNGNVDWFEKFRAWRELYKIKEVIGSADVVHCHDVFYWYLPFKFIYPRKKVFITFHGYEGNNIPNKRAVFMHMLAEKLTNGNICIGDFFKKWYKTEPTFVTYGAVNIKNKLTNKIHNKDIKIMFLGRVEDETGIMEYLEATKILKNKKISIKLDVYGDGSLMQKSKAYAKIYKLNVYFKGFIPDAEKHIKDYNYTFTSRYLGILEALASKRCVFAVYNNKIKKDYLKITPFAKYISISDNAESIANEVLKYIKNTKQIKLKEDGGFNWVKKYTWENLASLYLKLWTNK